MAEDKKTKQELEVQAKIANDFKLARNEADLALKASYSAEIQALLAECSKYNGVTQLTEVGKRLDKHLAKSGQPAIGILPEGIKADAGMDTGASGRGFLLHDR